ALKIDPDYTPSLGLLGSLKRVKGELDESIHYLDEILNENKEDVMALASKSRTLLKMEKNKEAMDMALQSTKIDDKNVNAMASLGLVYHFNKQLKERDNIIKKAQSISDSSTTAQLQYVLDVINGKDKL